MNPDLEGGFNENSITFSALWVTLTWGGEGGGGCREYTSKGGFQRGRSYICLEIRCENLLVFAQPTGSRVDRRNNLPTSEYGDFTCLLQTK
jgi:hypothetical protein